MAEGTNGLYFSDWGGLKALPAWCHFFAGCGSTFAQGPRKGRRIMAVSVPTRAFAAAFMGVGLIREVRASQTPQNEHVRLLSELAVGSPVFVRNDERKIRGLFRGIRRFPDGIRRIGVQVTEGQLRRHGGLTNWYPVEQAGRVLPADRASTRAPELPRELKQIDLMRNRGFLSNVLAEETRQELATRSELAFAIVGQINVLRREIRETTLAVKMPGASSEGTLQDILRVRRFSGPNDTFRSEVISVETGPAGGVPEASAPRVLVFDGALAFLRCRVAWPHADWLVVLDRTERHFAEAVAHMNEGYLGRASEWSPLTPSSIPEGVDVVSYMLEA